MVLGTGFARTTTLSEATACSIMEMAVPLEVGVAYCFLPTIFAATSTSAEKEMKRRGREDGVGVGDVLMAAMFRTTPTASWEKPDPTSRGEVGVRESMVASISARTSTRPTALGSWINKAGDGVAALDVMLMPGFAKALTPRRSLA